MTDSNTPEGNGRIALVTGASRGIGYACALELARTGVHVIITGRTIGALEELDDKISAIGGNATLVPLDLEDMDGIDRLGEAIHERWRRLDILVANAGILGTITPISHMDVKTFEKVMRINITANWRLMRSVERLLLKSEAGRVVVLSSGAPHSARPFWGPYAASKAALESLARAWAAETEQTKICVNCVNPGAVRTHMRAQAMPGEDPQTLPTAQTVAQKIVPLCSPQITRSGMIFDVRKEKFLSYQAPI